MLRLLTIGFILVLSGTFLRAQVEVSEPILMSSPNEQERTVQGLGYAASSTSAVNADVLLKAALIFDEATGTDQINIELDPAIGAYSAGMMLTFSPEGSNNGPATLNVNGLGAVEIKKDITMALDSGDLRPDVPVLVVHDGSVFQMIGQYSTPCPSGSLEMTREFCIEAQPRPKLDFWTAIHRCYEADGRLCTFGEWHYACRTDGSFSNSVLDYEWVDHAANSLNMAKRLGVDLNGTVDCFKGGLSDPNSTSHFRCCYNK